jgi:hypothetical protein
MPSSLWSTSTGRPLLPIALPGLGALAASIGWTRGADLQYDAFQTGQSLLEQHGGGRAGRGQQHGRAAYGGDRQAEGNGKPVLDRRLHRALAELT